MLASDVFLKRNYGMLSEVQKRVFCGVCRQQKGFGAVAVELNLGREQAEAIFCKGLELVFSEY